MFSVQGFRELFSTLRFRIVLWITLVVSIMVLAMNIGVREIEQRALRFGYDDYLRETVDDVCISIASLSTVDEAQLSAALKEKVKENEYRSLFMQVFDDKKNLIWGSSNANVTRPAPAFLTNTEGPYDGRRHRIFERRMQKSGAETYYVRCGFLQLALQEDIALINSNILWASLFLVVLAPLGGYVIAWRATRPISQVIETAALLEPANLKERLPIRGTGDEIDQLSKTINSMLDRLASFIAQNRDFLANAAHELRSPLAAIRSSVEVGLNHSRTPEEYTAILADVMEEIGRLAGLVNRLLLLAEADAGRLASRSHATRLEKIVLEAVMMFDAVAESNDVHLKLGPLDPALVIGDENSLRQVVRNLIDNAIKYNRSPGEVVVELHADARNKKATLIVRDTGIGIEAELLPRIFERFYRADKSRTRELERAGYGLGLSICKTIIDTLQGEITVESEIGRGTVFKVLLPLADESVPMSKSGENRFGPGLTIPQANPNGIQPHASKAAAAPE